MRCDLFLDARSCITGQDDNWHLQDGHKGRNELLLQVLLTPPPHPYTHHASVNCHPGEVFNYFKYKLVGRHKDIWKLALEESQMGTTGSIWRANDEAFYELISQRGRGGSFPGLEMIKIAADSNIEKVAFLLQLVQDPARLQWPSLTSSYERSYSTYAIQPKIHWNNEQTPPRREALPGGGGGGGAHFARLNFKTSRAGVYCRLLSALPSLSRFHSTRCRYFLGYVACQTLPWLGLRRVFFIRFLEKAGIDWCITVPYITLVLIYRWWPKANKLIIKFIQKTRKFQAIRFTVLIVLTFLCLNAPEIDFLNRFCWNSLSKWLNKR